MAGIIKKRSLGVFLWFLIVAAVLLMKYSTSSPAYFMNTWVDTNGNLTVGRAILKGIVPYRDLFEQRGPLLYFIYAFFSLVRTSNPFFGVYLYEVLCTAVFLYFCNKTLDVFGSTNADLFLITSPLFLWLMVRQPSFGLGGCPEELCLPVLMITSYILLKSIHQNTVVTFRQGIWIGLCAGYVFWIKYSMIGFFVGAAIPFLIEYGKKAQWKQIAKVILGVISGLGVITLPILVYFGINSALTDLFRVYFYDNIFGYSYSNKLFDKICYVMADVK